MEIIESLPYSAKMLLHSNSNVITISILFYEGWKYKCIKICMLSLFDVRSGR